ISSIASAMNRNPFLSGGVDHALSPVSRSPKELAMRYCWLAICCAVVLAPSVPVGQAQHAQDKKPKIPSLSPEQMRELLIKADKAAKALAGKSEVEYHRMMNDLIKRLRTVRIMGSEKHVLHPSGQPGVIVSPFAQARVKAQAKAAALASILN